MQVFVTARAERHFESIFKYIKEKWGEGTAKQFVLKTDKLFELLQHTQQWEKLRLEISEDFNYRIKQEYFIEFGTIK